LKLKHLTILGLGLTLAVLMSSCHMEKRLYNRGYHFQLASKKGSGTHDKTTHENREKKQEQAQETTAQEVEIIEANSSNNIVFEPAEKVKLDLTQTSTISSNKASPADSCDEIILKNGEIISGKITEISDTEVRYKRCGMLDGPTIVKKKSEILVIKYVNGQTEIIESVERNESPKFHTPKRRFSSRMSNAGFVISLASLLPLPLIDSISSYYFNTLLILIMLISVLSIVFSAIGMGKAAQLKREAKTDEEYNRARKQMNLGVAGLIIGIVVFVFCIALLLL
jgi:hypothetical protein